MAPAGLGKSRAVACADVQLLEQFRALWLDGARRGGQLLSRMQLSLPLDAPPSAWRRRPFWHGLFWGMAIAALCVVGIRTVLASAKGGPHMFIGPESALEMHAEYAMQKPGALDAFRKSLDKLPLDKPIKVFVHRGDARGGLAEQLVLYLAWPRPVDLSAKGLGAEGETIARLREKYSAIVLCGWHAPDAVSGVDRLGPGVEVVPFPPAPSPPSLEP